MGRKLIRQETRLHEMDLTGTKYTLIMTSTDGLRGTLSDTDVNLHVRTLKNNSTHSRVFRHELGE